MTDVFEEVEGQIRSDRYKSLALKSLPYLAGLVILVVIGAGGYWGWQNYRAKTSAEASEKYAAAIKDFDKGKSDEAVRIWTEVSKSPSKAYSTLALMQLGGVKISDNKPAEAVVLFDRAAKAAPNAIIGDVASLKAAFALLDTAPYKDLEARLTPLTQEGRPYRATAREALAFAKLMDGDVAGARSDFKVLTLMTDSSEGIRGRAQAAVDLIDSGSAKVLPAAVKAAAALPPPTPLPANAMPPGMGPPPSAPQPQATGPQ